VLPEATCGGNQVVLLEGRAAVAAVVLSSTAV